MNFDTCKTQPTLRDHKSFKIATSDRLTHLEICHERGDYNLKLVKQQHPGRVGG